MATHRRTEWADAVLGHNEWLQGLARVLMRRQLTEEERLTLGLALGSEVLNMGQLSEAIRRGEHPPELRRGEPLARLAA